MGEGPATSGTAVLVEGLSDRIALETLANRLNLDLSAGDVHVVDIGGVTNFRTQLTRLGPRGMNLRLAGLCDQGEATLVLHALRASDVAPRATLDSMAAHGFFVCQGELEDELLAAVGVPALLQIIERHGDWPRFRTMQRQLVYRTASLDVQVRYLMTQKKIAYAADLIHALDLSRVPTPLSAVLRFAAGRA